mmetsp:Transcript_58858/g.128886  ORF Transcript_58858/g.128886 Transcript_58858/m.128886 type:complete len:568 (+) Transcript_58858:81-1784(+)
MGDVPGEVWDISDEDFGLENIDRLAANDDETSEEDSDEMVKHDILIHKWCQRQLGDLLSKLSLEPQAAPFLVPVDWETLGLDDYPEIVQNPIDLHTIRKRLDASSYDDVDGLVDPELFFKDVALCWDNCLDYFENDLEVEVVQMALNMSSVAKRMEEAFWADLAAFEESVEKRPLTTKVALAATRMGDAAKKAANKSQRKTVVFANDMVKFAAEWWQGQRKESPFWRDEKEFKEHLVGLVWPSRFKRAIAVVRETVRRVPLSLLGSEQAVQTFVKPLAESILRTVSSLSMPSGVRVLRDTIADIKGEWILPENYELQKPNSHTESILVWAHGGGFVLCSPATHRFFLARIVMHTGVPTFCVDFRKPPRHPFPVPRDDILRVYKGILELGYADAVFLGGDSAGGNLVLSVTKELAEGMDESPCGLSLPPPEGLILLSPWVDLSDTDGESWQKYADVDYIPSRHAEVIAGIYAKGVPLRDSRVSPGRCRSWPPCFPRTLLDYGGCEVFRTQIERLADSMMHHGVELDATVEDGMVHCYPQLEYLWGPDPDGPFDAYFKRVSTFMAMKYF